LVEKRRGGGKSSYATERVVTPSVVSLPAAGGGFSLVSVLGLAAGGGRFAEFAGERFRARFLGRCPVEPGAWRTDGIAISSAVAGGAYGCSPVVDPRRPLTTERRATMAFMAKVQTNGKIKRLSDEELAELLVLPTCKTPEEKRAAIKRATTGLYRPR